jgi:hypothetical protein
MGLDELKQEVINRLGKDNVQFKYFVNERRNFVIETEQALYLLKWNDAPFYKAGDLIKDFDGAVGETVSQSLCEEHFMKVQPQKEKHIVFQWTDSPVYYTSLEEFMSMAKQYEQKGGEKVLVVPINRLKTWNH